MRSPEDRTAAGPPAEAAARAPHEGTPTLSTERLSVTYRTEEGDLPAVRDVNLNVWAGQAVGLVGESGSGKTTFALGAIGYLPANGRIERGSSRLYGTDLVTLRPKQMRELWGSKIGLVSQDPQGALNPTLTIGRQLDEMGVRHLGLRRGAARRATLEMLTKVDMPDPTGVAARYPHQLSGGMLQRCCIAMALLTRPDLMILDEPTTSLDVTTQAMILDLLKELGAEFHLAFLHITHNLGVISRFCDRVVVMYAGEVLEEGEVAEIFSRPLHPYTANLLRCVPRLPRNAGASLSGRPGGERLATLPGDLPALNDLPTGCIFAPRCPLMLASCTVDRPRLMEAGSSRLSACFRWSLLMSEQGQKDALAVSATESVPATISRRRTGGTEEEPADPSLPAALQVTAPLLVVKNLAKEFPGPHRHAKARAVDGVDLSFPPRQTFGLVGESGSGKTTLARMIAGLTPPTSGTILFASQELRATVGRRKREVLRRLQMVFQNPDSSLNPRHTVRQELVRPLMRVAGFDRHTAREFAAEVLRAVRLPASYLDRYPGELSGGEKQRIAIARAFVGGPDLVLCDEPVSSLDVSVQGALMNLLLDLQKDEGTSYFFISHDISAVQHLSQYIGVMYRGRLVEQGEASKVLSPPYHPYTEALLDAIPDPDASIASVASVRPRDQQPVATEDALTGCLFYSRCPRNLGEMCAIQEPPWRRPEDESPPDDGQQRIDSTHAICCHIAYEKLRADQLSGSPPGSDDSRKSGGPS